MTSLKKNFFYSSLLTTANYIFPLLTFPYVSRVLGVSNVGIVNFVDSVINYFILFSMMGINVVGIREIAKKKTDKSDLSATFSSLFWLNTISLIILIIVTYSVPLLKSHSNMMAIGASKLLFNYLLIEWFYKGLEVFKFITIRSVLVKMLFVISVFLFVQKPEDYAIYYFLIAMTIVINALINIYYARHFVLLKCKGVKPLLYLNSFFIFGIYMLLTSMYTSFNVAFLGFVSGETQVGYYSIASKIFNIIIAIFTAFTGVMMPRLSALREEGNTAEFIRLVEKSKKLLISFSLPIIAFLIVYTPTIILIIGGNGYEGSILPMRIMLPLIFVIGYEQIIIIQILMPMQKDKLVLNFTIMGALVGVSLNILLVPIFKCVGSSCVWLISEFIVMILAQLYLSRKMNLLFPWYYFKKHVIYIFLLVIILVICNREIPNVFFSFVVAAILTSITYYIVNFYILRDVDIVMTARSFISSLNSIFKK